MNEVEKQKVIGELEVFCKELRSYKNRQLKRKETEFTESQNRSLDALRLKLQREHGRLGGIISKYAGKCDVPILGIKYEVFSYSLGSLGLEIGTFDALDGAISLVNEAIGALESMPLADTEVQDVSVTQPPKDAAELPNYLFNRMQFHPRLITSSKSLFETGHYSQAIFEAFKAVNNFVKEKTGLTLDGKALMSKVFDENAPIIKINELLTKSDKDEQEGFKFLFMGAMVGVRNPKAHDEVIQTDPYRTLEYLSLASLLMKRIEEGKVVKL